MQMWDLKLTELYELGNEAQLAEALPIMYETPFNPELH